MTITPIFAYYRSCPGCPDEYCYEINHTQYNSQLCEEIRNQGNSLAVTILPVVFGLFLVIIIGSLFNKNFGNYDLNKLVGFDIDKLIGNKK